MRTAVLLSLAALAAGDEPHCTSICMGNGTVPSSHLDVEIEVEGNTVTCSSLEFAVGLGEFEEEECAVAHAIGVGYCGCPDIRSPADYCYLCEDGSMPDLSLDFDSETSCLDLFTDLFLDPKGDQCRAIQAVQGSYCGCNNIQASLNACRLCGDRGLMPNTTIMASDQHSCGQIEHMVNDINASDCEDMQNLFGETCCDYSAQPNCTSICPDGVINNTDTVLNIMGGMTCAELEEEVSLGTSTEEQCSEFHFLAAHYCGCSAPRTGAITCPLCEDGSQPPDYDLESLHGRSCLAWATSNSTIGDEAECSSFQSVQGAYCGCDNEVSAKNACRVCGTSNFLPELNRKSSQETRAEGQSPLCGEIEAIANRDRENCDTYQTEATAIECCGTLTPTMAPTTKGAEPFCDICSFPNMTYLKGDTIMNTPFGDYTCDELDNLGRANHIHATDCLWVQIGAPGVENCHCVPKSANSPSTVPAVPSSSTSSEPTRSPTPGKTQASDSSRRQSGAIVLLVVSIVFIIDMIV